MHFKNENDLKANSHQHCHNTATTTSTSSNASSTDSGVIIIDNRATIGNKKSNNNTNSNSNSNNSNSNNKNSYSNNNNNSKNNSTRIEIPADKIDNNENTEAATTATTIKPDKNSSSEKFNNEKSAYHKINQNNDECSNFSRPKSINIENIINITKGVEASNAGGQQHQRLHNDLCSDDGYGGDEATSSAKDASSGATTKQSSPCPSIRSTSISIVSIDENAIDSSVIDSDSDREADAEGVHANYVVKKLGQQTTYPAGSAELPNITKGLTVISQQINPNSPTRPDHVLNGGFRTPPAPQLSNAPGELTPASPQIGSIALTNSTDVTFGDKHYYEGPVTIQQILIGKANQGGGHDNPAFATEPGFDAAGSQTKQNTSQPPPETPYSFICKRKAIVITTAVVLLTIVVGVILLTTTRQSKTHDDDDEEYNTLLVMGRKDWGAREPKGVLDKLNLPVHRVVISHTASDTCMDTATCSDRARVIQTFHMDSNNWDDIGYNFLIGGDGYVYSGRGWRNQGAHTKGYNDDSIGISFIGTFTTIKPTKRQVEAAKLLIEEGIRQQAIAPNFCVYGARQLGATESPGLALYNIIKTWPHWSHNINCGG